MSKLSKKLLYKDFYTQLLDILNHLGKISPRALMVTGLISDQL